MNTGTKLQSAASAVPARLCVDLDGTLIQSDLMWECIGSLLHRPWVLTKALLAIRKGRAPLKRALAVEARIDIAALPYCSPVIDYIIEAKKRGRSVILATAADADLANRIAEQLGFFDAVVGTREGKNLKGLAKLEALAPEDGYSDIEYVGNARSDLVIFRHVGKATAVARSSRFKTAVLETRHDANFLDVPSFKMLDLIRAMRIKHWSKNVLLFVPLILAHALKSTVLLQTVWGALAFSLVASAVYLLNDVLDVQSDRLHPWKSKRPLAAARMSIRTALFMSMSLLGTSLVVGYATNGLVACGLLILYFVSSIAYSTRLKRIPILDVLLLASFYVQRVIFGSAIGKIPASNWLLAFCLFFFFSMALAKRYSELVQSAELIANGKSRRGYEVGDVDFVRELGLSAGLIAVLVVALYVHAAEAAALYPRANLLWVLVPALLFWVSHIWLFANRGKLVEDPIVMAFKDRTSLFVGLVAAAILAISAIR